MNEEKKEYIKQWLKKAKDDYDAYRVIIDSEYPLHAIAGFIYNSHQKNILKLFLNITKSDSQGPMILNIY